MQHTLVRRSETKVSIESSVLVRNKVPSFKAVYANAFCSHKGRDALVDMMQAIKDTPYDMPFCDAVSKSGFLDRHINARNASKAKKSKVHADAIAFGMGEQADGAVNELRGAVSTKKNGVQWTPRADLKPEKDWLLTDLRLLEAIDEACKKSGPLAQSADKRNATLSKSHGRAAAFVPELIACIIAMHDDLIEFGS